MYRNIKCYKGPSLKKAACALFGVFIALSVTGCKRGNENREIELPITEVLSLKSRWGVITSSHLRLRSKPSVTSQALTTLWRGYVLEILSRKPQKEEIEELFDYWYQIRYDGLQGWVFGAYLELYDTKTQAEHASEELE
jgi:hypothetical protein